MINARKKQDGRGGCQVRSLWTGWPRIKWRRQMATACRCKCREAHSLPSGHPIVFHSNGHRRDLTHSANLFREPTTKHHLRPWGSTHKEARPLPIRVCLGLKLSISYRREQEEGSRYKNDCYDTMEKVVTTRMNKESWEHRERRNQGRPHGRGGPEA